MTREETKMKTFDILRFVADNAGLSTFEAIEKAYNIGVSEQESVLDKIKAEISDIRDTDYRQHRNAYNKCLEIIDKYREDSE